ncbi:MAG: hypothetical protein WCK28_13165 [Burkholderiales bacterium]|jgi:hypothetical protein
MSHRTDPKDWFHALAGFDEVDWASTRARLELDGDVLRSRANGASWRVGLLETPTLAQLRQRAAPHRGALEGTLRVRCESADVRALHRDPSCRDALFQVASQFNLLEMVGPEVTPEDGVGRYEFDRTQGPACAIAAGAATIYRNYFAEVGGAHGQTRDRQIDCLRDLGLALGNQDGTLWTMRNGYALCSGEGLARIDARLAAATPVAIDALRALLRVGTHWDVEVTELPAPRPRVSQVFCSALPVAYTRVPASRWARFATLILEAAYEATLWAAVINAAERGSRTVLLTQLGGGAFGNDEAWIEAAQGHALERVRGLGLDVRLVAYGEPSAAQRRVAARFGA